jgi:hypothetical protein
MPRVVLLLLPSILYLQNTRLLEHRELVTHSGPDKAEIVCDSGLAHADL